MNRTFRVLGVNAHDQSRYQGTLRLIQTGDMLWELSVTVANDTFDGYAIGDGTTLSILYEGAGTTYIGQYSLRADGAYEGIWTIPGDGRIGSEVWQPM